jgi:hypothetical protein
MAELLLDLPAGSQRDMVMAGFKKMMDGLLPLQVSGGTDDGMWRQVPRPTRRTQARARAPRCSPSR